MTSTARIEVGQRFCDNCSISIKKKLQVIEDIKNVQLYPKESLITFNFIKANKLSIALNVLSEIGYPEKGERINIPQFLKSACRC
ncbi:hypothetical protein [Ascidiimonas sp. W6]|uniref:hypothetical protein n=1 Tax=Ascidiimonas meishanensis TaxID=3128903 RepID=UPI0030ED5917